MVKLLLFVCWMVVVAAMCVATIMGAPEHKKVQRMLLKRSSNDQESSATGYIYRQDGNGPASILYLSGGQVSDHFAGKSRPYSFPTGLVTTSGSKPSYGLGHSQYYGNFQQPNYKQPYVQHNAYKPPHFVQQQSSLYRPYVAPQVLAYKAAAPPVLATYKVAAAPQILSAAPIHKVINLPAASAAYKTAADNSGSSESESEESGESAESNEENSGDHGQHYQLAPLQRRYGTSFGGLGYSAAYHNGGGADHHGSAEFVKKGGSEYGEEGHAKHGHKGHKGYNNEHAYSKGDKGSHANEHHEGYYDHHGDKKASHYDEGDEYGEHHKGEKGTKGGKFGEKKHHKKGSKTTGYHNVFHKDEYKKDHTFYDDADHKGNFKKYGSDHQYHKDDEGKHASGGHHHSGHQEGKHGKKGHTDKGHYDDSDQGYKRKHGQEQYHNDHEEYGKKGGSAYGNEHKYEKERHGGHH